MSLQRLSGSPEYPDLTVVPGETSLMVHKAGRRPSAKVLEEIGEDYGLFQPSAAPGPEQGSWTITEGFTGELCRHEYGPTFHFGRNPSGMGARCGKCGIVVSSSTPRRGKVSHQYGAWELRGHVYHAWLKYGPVPGSLAGEEAGPSPLLAAQEGACSP